MTINKLNSTVKKLQLLGFICVCELIFSTSQAAIYPSNKDDLMPLPSSLDKHSKDVIESYDELTRPLTKTEGYEEEFIKALLAFRDNRISETLERSKALHMLYPQKVDPLNLIAASYLRMGHWDKAKIELEKVLKLDPNEPSAMKNLAIIEMKTGSTQRSKELLTTMLKKTPDDKELTQLLAEAETQEKRRAEEGESLELIVARNPKDLDARTRFASEQMNAGNYAKVLVLTGDLKNEQYQKMPALLELKGKAQLLTGELESAQKSFEQWTQIEPKSADAHFYYGDSLIRSGDKPGAQKALNTAIKINPQHLLARVGEIKLFGLLNKPEEANKALTQLEKDFGNRIEVLGIAGWLALNTGDFVNAEKKFTEALSQQPSSEITVQLVRALWGQKKHDEALDQMQVWLKDNPQDQAVLLHLAGAYLSLEKNDEAIAAYQKVADINPDYFPVFNNLAWLNRDKDLNKAMQYAQKAQQLAPEDPFILDTLGMLTLKKGDVNNAYNLVKKATERLPNEAQFQLHLSKILIQKENNEEAKKILNALVSQIPDTEIGKEAKTLLDQIPK